MRTTTNSKLKERQDTPLVLTTSEESFNSTNLRNTENISDGSKLCFHSGSGYNTRKGGRMSAHNVFVLDKDRKPLSPTTNSKARRLIEGKQAKPVWNKFSQFGIQMLVDTRKETPKTVLGVDFGTKFEGYIAVTGKENNLAVMWKLPDKKHIVRKLEERRNLRKARRFRNCRRREARFDNRERKGFLAPSQRMMVQSRLKAMQEFFKSYPIDTVALEDVRFNHRDNRWGKNFSTIEVGKHFINKWIQKNAKLLLFAGYNTQDCRERYGYKKSSDKGAEVFNSHCSDALAIATDIYFQKHIPQGRFIIVDDTYRPVRRKLHYTQPTKGKVLAKYSTGNFKGIRKGTMCGYGQIVGGTRNQLKILPINKRDSIDKRISKSFSKLDWLSHHFQTKG